MVSLSRARKFPRVRSVALLAAAATAAIVPQLARAADGTWSVTTSGNWSDTNNWSGAAVADGAGSTAFFNAVDLPGDLTVTLDTVRTIGNLNFGDTDTSTAGSWILGNGGNAANILTLDGGTPTITVNALGTAKVAQIDAQITATSLGFTKAGAGQLILTNTLNTTGPINVTGGTLTNGVTSGASALGAGAITLQGGATLTTTTAAANTYTFANTLAVPTGQTATFNAPIRIRQNGAVSGGGTLNYNVTTNVSRNDLQNSWTGFTGNLNFTGGGTVRLGINALASGQPNFNAAGWASTNMDLGGSVQIAPNTNSGGNTIQIGALSGSSATAALAAHSAGGSATWQIGALNTSTTFAGGIRGSENVTKVGTGTLTLTNTTLLDTTGAINVNAGVLKIDGNKTGAGAVNVANNATLAGTNGSVAGTTTIASGGHLAAGGTTSVGTLNVATLTLNAGSFIDSEFNNTPANDLINVTSVLTINGGSVNLFNEGGATPFSTNGTYNLIQYTGGINGTGIGALAVNNPQAGKTYAFGTDGTFVNLTISSAGAPIFWNKNIGGTWGSAANWTAGGPPNAVGAFAGLGGGGTPIAAPSTLTLDGDKTVGTLSFNSANSFTVAQGSGGSLILDNASSPAALTSGNGSHTISAPVSVSGTGVNANIVNGADTVTVSGAITGTGPITNIGAGTLVLGGNNTGYTGLASATAGKLVLNNANALANATLAGGAGNIGFGSNSTFNVTALSGTGTITTVDAGTIAVGADNSTATFAGVLAGPTGLAKNGAGTLTLSGANSFGGGLAVNGGSVVVRANQTYGGNTTVANGATLALATNSSIVGSVSLADGATFSMLPLGTTGDASIFPGNALNLPSGGTAILTSAALGNGYNGSVTGDATSTLSVTGQTSMGSQSLQQLAGHLGTVRVESGAALRFSASSNLNNGGPSTTFDIQGALQTRNGGAVALGAITGAGILRGGQNADGTVTYTIGGANTSTTFAGTIQDGSAVNRAVAITKTGSGNTTLTGPLTYTGNTAILSGTLKVVGNLTTSASVAAVTGGKFELADGGGSNRVIHANSISAGSGTIDIRDNKLITNSLLGTGVAGGGAYTTGTVAAMIQSGSNGGAWDGIGLTTSMPDATGGLTSIGSAVASDVRDFGVGTTLLFAGETITPTNTIAMYTYAGDANLDGQITGDDYSGIDFTILDPNNVGGWFNGDFNYDGFVSGDDYSAIDFNILAQGAPFPSAGSLASASGLSGVTAVPEPATMSVLGLGAAALMGRRRRQAK